MDEKNSYEIIKPSEIKRIIENEKLEFIRQIPNANFIYRMENQEILVMTNKTHLNGLILKDLDILEYFLEQDKFPLENITIYNFEKFHNLVLQINNVDILIDQLFQLNENFRLTKNYTLIDLELIFNSRFDYKLSVSEMDEFLFYFGGLLGNLYAKNHNLTWMLKKEYAEYNPYYVPILVNENGFYLDIYLNMNSAEGKSINLNSIIWFIEGTKFKLHINQLMEAREYPNLFNMDLSSYP